jgi:hypothetical protein
VNRYSPVPAVPARPSLLAVIAVLLALALAACSPDPAPSGPVAGQPTPAGPIATPVAVATPVPAPTAVATALPTAVPTPAPSPTPAVDYQGMKVNELGTIPILQYHIIGDEDGRWERSAESFRRDLEKLYAAGYRPIALADLLDNRIDLPAGTSPVIFSFDDSSPGQFRYIERDGQLVIDPDSAVGMLEEFHARHPDWELRGVFSVLPEAEQPHKLFGQPEYEEKKLQYLVERGFEIANHTWWHQRLDIVDDEEVQRQLAFAVRDIEKRVPGYRVRAFTLPLGLWPENEQLAVEGSYEGFSYRHDAILLVGSEPAPSPNHREYDPLALPRVQVFEDNLDRWLRYLDQNPDERYVSDGNPGTVAFPRHLENQLDPASLGGKQTRPY